MTPFKVVVIGAGQAGLASAQQLTNRGLRPGSDFLILDANDGPGGAWRHRWDSLTLGKTHGIADLPGLAAPRGDDTVPASRLVSEYYGSYEELFNLAVRRPIRVLRVSQDSPHVPFQLELSSGESICAHIIISATGTWDSPFIPHIPGIETFQGKQLHTKDFVRAADFADRRTVVVGGGLSAIQFLLELGAETPTVWATRQPPEFLGNATSASWGLDVEKRVRARTLRGEGPGSVVSNTGIPARTDYHAGVNSGLLVSRGMFDQITPEGVVFAGTPPSPAYGWDPLPAGTFVDADIIFWNTGFRPSLQHLAPLHLRSPRGGIHMTDEVTTARNPRVLLAGYGSTASTIGATRAGRRAASAASKLLR
ncbi:NAD(P)-binding domain-containing protein [Corynebacterium sp. H128]|uniref:NAD(P)-binding domain-containing protein n=1 Tax=Corynebacterium sp. H128 TaxID=3133427 RepID=UPI0030B05775